jgi:hypothetical protein
LQDLGRANRTYESISTCLRGSDMKRPTKLFILLALVIIPSATCHVPDSPGDNYALVDAKVIDRPSKSWAVYSNLRQAKEAQYYSFEVDEGDRIRVELLVSTDPDEGDFNPSLALLRPGTIGESLPDFVEVPDGYGGTVAEGERTDHPSYEGFTPSSYYRVGGLDIAASSAGTYYVVVYSPTRGGRYSLVLGYVESFSPAEWILIPLNVIRVYRWGGQGMIEVLMPMVGVVLAGSLLCFMALRRRAGPLELFQLPMIFVGLTYLGSTGTILYQMAFNLARVPLTPEAAITATFAILPLILGVGALGMGLGHYEGFATQTRVRVLVLGLSGLLFWAGMVIGPAVAISTCLLPSRRIPLGSTGLINQTGSG